MRLPRQWRDEIQSGSAEKPHSIGVSEKDDIPWPAVGYDRSALMLTRRY